MENVTRLNVGAPLAAGLNASSIDFTDIKMDRNFMLLMASLASAMAWVVYITYYNSRVLGFILTRLINKFYFQDGNFKIGSFTLNALSGKIMFRDIVYINCDYTLRIQDGYLIFRWWRSYVPKDVSEDLSHSDTRVSLMLNGFELHLYNRCEVYDELSQLFGLAPAVAPEPRPGPPVVRGEAAQARTWRDLVPVVKCDIWCARVVFGNPLVRSTLSLTVEEAHVLYSTKPPASSLDHLMHFVKAKADNCKVMLAPSPNYTDTSDEPPRYMGEGFVVMSSNFIEVYFYMDEPGLVPERPVLLQLANGDVVESTPPIWGVDIKCGKGTDFSYGPWADRQRDQLFKFFFPPNYKNLEVTPQPKPGDRRQMQSFDIRLSTLNEATIDILFTKNKETNAVHINIGAGSYLEVTLPWIVLQDGYTTKITGQLLHLEATSSLQYRSLVESETLEYNVKCHYPLVWNHHQCWQLSLTGCKATAHLVYTHIDFFQDLVNDWSSKAQPDILSFVPYTWKISLLMKECEVVTLSNQYNWVDCSSTNQENSHVAFCGDLLDVSFDLPFVDFLPDVIPLKIWVQGEAVDMSLYLPEVSTSRLLLLSIDKNMKLVPCRLKASKWRRKCVKSQGWVDCWSVPIVALSVRYNYHPMPPLGPKPQANIATPEKEEFLLSPMRIPDTKKRPQSTIPTNNFDRTSLPPDKVSVELEVGPSVLIAYGTIINSFMNLVENIFGEDQIFTDMQKVPDLDAYFKPKETSKQADRISINQQTETKNQNNLDAYFKSKDASSKQGDRISISQQMDLKNQYNVENSMNEPFDPRRWRPMDVTVSIIIHDIQAHLVKNCSENEPPCPVVLIDRFGFEMDKTFRETKLQLLVSPSVLVSSSSPPRNGNGSSALSQGHLMLSSLQLRGHGLFSDTNRSVEEETIEYAWMMELQLGQLTGRLTLPQLYQVVSSLETFLLLLCDSENELCPPNPVKQCHHGVNSTLCPESDFVLKYRCPTANEIKYRMVRVAVDLIDIYIADTSTTLQTCITPIRLAFCNLHGPGCDSGITALLPSVKLALYTQTNMQTGNANHNSNGSNGSQSRPSEAETWVGVGTANFGPVIVEAAAASEAGPKNMQVVQQKFLKIHDEKTKRLWFAWPGEGKNAHCGCTGGCVFFGSNRNGPNFLRPAPGDLADGINVATFKVLDGGEFGYGQSLLHAGQLVFHTPPYSGQRVCLQPARVASPAPPRPRRASHAGLARRDVPYARLVDAPQPKPDSDSTLHRAGLTVETPQMESSVSDSRLALGCVRPPVPASDSRHSLDRAPPPRTVSVTSENHSEAFFSADEDAYPSRSSSLRHSLGARPAARERASLVGDGSLERRPDSAPRSEPVPAPAPDSISNLSVSAPPDSESGSVSSTSFISAISSQEDMTLVNLHMQTNRPIVDSPLLMSSYMHNLPQYRCSDWATCSPPTGDGLTVPLLRRAEDGSLAYAGQRYLPHFEPLGRGGVARLTARREGGGAGGLGGPRGAHPLAPGWWDALDEDTGEGCDGERHGVLLRVLGDAEVSLTPLVLESTQRFVEALTPVLAGEHPATVLSQLRLRCVAAVQAANVLKRRHHADRWLPRLRAPRAAYEATLSSRLRLAAALPRLHVVLLQSSVVEDMISFAALDDIQDLTCVSLFGVCLENVTAKFASSTSTLESVQLCYRPTLKTLASKKMFGIMKGPRSLISGGSSRKSGVDEGEPVYVETALQHSEDNTFTLTIGKMHGQLRRIRNESSQLKDATITGIPSQHSKVSFKFIRSCSCSKNCDASQGCQAAEASLGHIMFECGLEGVTVKVSQHSQAHKGEDKPEEKPAEPAAKPARTSAFDDFFRKRDESKPGTPQPTVGSTAAPAGGTGVPGSPGTPASQDRASETALALPRAPGSRAAVELDVKVVWFNFAAPPRTPITGRIDYTRLDWNLLSTAAPAINAWLNPSNRLAIKVVALYRAAARRRTATAASLMAAALDTAPKPMPPKSRYGRLTPMARQLREEPSLQLLGALVRHALAADAAALQADLAERHLPSLSTLRQGVIVLARQWKNVLYTPMLLEHNYKNKLLKPLNVTFALPELLEESTEGWVAEGEVGDESCLLLRAAPECLENGSAVNALGSQTSIAPGRTREDLYQWMAKQEPAPQESRSRKPMIPAFKMNPLAAAAALPACSLYPLQGSLMLLDAHLVFQPLLRALGVSPNQVPHGSGGAAALESLGSRLSLQCTVEAARVDFVVGELGRRRTAAAAPPAPALLCEKIVLEFDIKKVADVAVEDLVQRRNVVYISRGQLKRHISTMLNFTLNIKFISQQVNMPLLRLLHQISNMYQNVKDAQQELRAQTDSTHRRNKHTSSSVSDFRENIVSVSSLDGGTQYSTLESKWEEPVLVEPVAPPAQPVGSQGSGPRTRSRPQSFAQKFRSTSKSVKGKLSSGYSALPAAVSPAAPPLAPRCWRTVYQLLDLYAHMPDADTITHRFSMSTDIPEQCRVPRPSSREQTNSNASSAVGPLGIVVVGEAKIHRTQLLASLSGLKLEAEIAALQASLQSSRTRQWSLTGTLGRTAIVLLEGSARQPQTVLRVTVGKSQALYSWESGRAGASTLLSVGPVRVELPQHPVALHGVMTRSSRQLSSTLQELGVTPPRRPAPAADTLPTPPQLQFTVELVSLSVTAALLPSLQAQYKMEQVRSSGVTGAKAHFTVELPIHSLSFVTRLAAGTPGAAGGAGIPAAAAILLPAVAVAGRVLEPHGAPPAEGAVLRAGRYLAATADIGLFEHTLSTDLLNHLVFVQKVFMKEVNEVVQKVYGGEKPVPLWGEEEGPTAAALSRVLFSLVIRIKRIQLTATTPSNSAVRLETGAVELELSNRVQNVPQPAAPHTVRLFARAQVDLNLSLGQLIRNAMFEEAEAEFQQYAFFNTRISMRNAFQEERAACDADKEVVLITLKRPLVYVQPVAVDRAVLVWLNYRAAYEYWSQQRRCLNKEVLQATQQLIEKVQQSSASTSRSTLFLQLDVDDIGICVPLREAPRGEIQTRETRRDETERGAVLVTLEATSVSACSSGALVSKGRFVGLCLRFASDFEASLDDWKPRADEPSLNVCCVSEGTYEVCSRTAAATSDENAKWFLNVAWQMEGVDIHLDVSVGKQLSALGHTLTMLTGFEEEEEEARSRAECESEAEEDTEAGSADALPAFALDTRLDARTRSRLLELEMSEQARIIADLRSLGATHTTIEQEVRRLHDLEALASKDFRRDVLQKLRRQSVKASTITKGKLGLGSNRSRSFVASAPPAHPRRDKDLEGLIEEARSEGSGEALLGDEESSPRLSDVTEGVGGTWGGRGGSLRSRIGVQRQASLPAHTDPWPIEDEPVELRRKVDHSSSFSESTPDCKANRPKPAEPNVDFELDVKVHVNSGKCVLHTKESPKEEEVKRSGRVGRSMSGGLEPPGSPGRRRRALPAPDHTVFQVPGLNLKVHYESKTAPELTNTSVSSGPAAARRAAGKKAALLAWLTLQSIPEETVISPHILDFLEQALEPIPIKAYSAPTPASTSPPCAEAEGGTGADAGAGDAENQYGQYVYASFPVDVIVHFHMQPSTFRFSCLPASRVECLLQLPSLQIVFSSKRAGDQDEECSSAAASGGLSVTGCLADFSVYVFHPYGGHKSSLKEAQWSPQQDSQRKDSLSINVEFVKFHLSRSRKLDFHPDFEHAKATVRFSTIVDVGSAWFKYDMRRLGEILAFPKAWYRRTIVRRMFLGDLGLKKDADDDAQPPTTAPVSPAPHREKAKTIEKSKGSESEDETDAAWETLVLFAVNFTKLNVHMNMGNVMGNVSWQSEDFNCTGRLSIGSNGHRNMLVGVALASSALDARGGIVGGGIALSSIHTYVHISEEAGLSPCHVCGVRLAALELRLEYMGAAVLLARVSALTANARDDWRPRVTLAHSTLAWQQLQLLMSRSTTPDLIKMQHKLEEFFSTQFKSSKRVLSALHPEYRLRPPRPPRAGDTRRPRHWARALTGAKGALGGTVQLQGTNVSLACFHGTSFKAKSWALFSLKEPSVSFATEAQQPGDVVVTQSLAAALGGEGLEAGTTGHRSMATVCRMTRALLFPPQFKTLREWFAYAFAGSEIDAIDLFPSMEKEANPAGNPSGAGAGTNAGNTPAGKAGAGAGAAHVREVIFALPSLELHLRTQQRQHDQDTEEKPVVECSFITEFHDHIFVSVDAEAFLFLHDLISSYIKEKDRVWSGGSTSGSTNGSAAAGRSGQDLRDYRCVTWQLEPTVRLLSWAGKSIEPYGVDYILQKLGFSHARTTIPKWLQRGALDPLDKILALVLLQVVAIVPRK